MLRPFVITSACIVGGVTSVAYAQGSLDTKKAREALDLITETADRVCYNVPINGSAQSIEARGRAEAEISGLLSKLAKAGISGSGKFAQDQYENLPRDAIPSVVRNYQECRLKVFESLRSTLLVEPPKPTNNNIQTPDKASIISGIYRGVTRAEVVTVQGKASRSAKLELDISVGPDGAVSGQFTTKDDQGTELSGPVQGKVVGDKVRIDTRSYPDDADYSAFEGRVSGNTIKGFISVYGSQAAQERSLLKSRGLPEPYRMFEVRK